MKKANIIRAIFWGTIGFLCLSCGIIGLVENYKIFKEREPEISNIITTFNNAELIKNYEKVNTKINAEIINKKIIINYDGVEKKEYIFKIKNGYLETSYNINDSIGKIITMLVTDSIAITKGQSEGNTYNLFNSNSLYSYTLPDGIEYTNKGDKYKVKINLDNYLLAS